MKVTTDGCLFGAWVADQINEPEPKRILDIGTGTGLLSLMLAQATQGSQLDAIEINEGAFEEATDNFKISPWEDRLHSVHTSLQAYKSEEKHDLIICNPPFFANNPKGDQANKNQALHSDHLSVEELTVGITQSMNSKGKAFILYPEREMNQFILEAEKADLFLNNLTIVRNRKADRVFRMMGQFSLKKSETAKHEIIIREEDRSYTKEFWSLVEGYYL